MDKRVENLIKSKIVEIRDYPKNGEVFRDITPLLKDGKAFALCIEELADHFRNKKVDYVAGIEELGFVIGASLAKELDCGFVPIRKKGLLPRKTVSKSWAIGDDNTIEMHEDAIDPGKRVVVCDDAIEKGDTAKAAADLLKSVGANVVGFAFVLELTDKGPEKLGKSDIFSLIKY